MARDQGTEPGQSGSDPPPDDVTHRAEANMRRLVLALRLLGWLWMLLLVIATLAIDEDANRTITIATMVFATVWAGVTVWAAQRRSRLGTAAFVIADGVACLLIASASYAAGAEDLFHGGYPISWMGVAAYGGGLRWAVPASLVLMVQQALLLLQNGRTAVAAVGSIVFLVYALIIGWLFTMIRASDRQRRITAAELTAEREENARRLERLTLANKLHDSALQTLQVIDTDAEDADRVRTLARRQSRELRDLVEGYADGDSATLRSELMSAVSDVEQLFGVEVSAVIRTEVEVDDTVRTLVDASREAMTNAAKYSGVPRIDVYAAMYDGMLTIYVRDEGSGFDPDSVVYGHGVRHSIIERVEDAGGTAELSSAPGQGTEVALSVLVGVARV